MTVEEMEFAKYLKTFGNHANIALVCNKCDNLFDEGDVINESSKLGFKKMFTVSAEEGTGVLELLNFINDSIPSEVK
jgi:predicted GTPase